VSPAVVDVFETVQIEEKDGEPPVGEAARQGASEPFVQQTAICQARERVVLRQLFQALFVQLGARDVAKNAEIVKCMPP
jgi:hypothetical protein